MQDELPVANGLDVSVVMPAFNAADYIRAAIQSVQTQAVTSLEIIVVDDASTDDTAAIVLELATRDSRIRHVRMPTNAGPSASRNRGLKLARGEWVALLDADDRFHPRRLESLLSLGQHHGADIVSDNVLLCTGEDATGRKMISEDRLPAPQWLSFSDFIEGCYADANTPRRTSFVLMHPMFKREYLISNNITYNETTRNGEDFLFYVDCFLAGATWYVTPEPMYIYLIRDGSLTECASREDRSLQVTRLRTLMRDSRVAQDAALSKAVKRHWKHVATDLYYWSFRDAFRAANARGAIQVLSHDRAASVLIAQEALLKGQKALRNAFAGGRAAP